jgi:hypothetical protein
MAPPPHVTKLQRATITFLYLYFSTALHIITQGYLFSNPALYSSSWFQIIQFSRVAVIGVITIKAHGFATSETGLDPFINGLLGGGSSYLAYWIQTHVAFNIKSWKS